MERISLNSVNRCATIQLPTNRDEAYRLFGNPDRGAYAIERNCVLVTDLPFPNRRRLYIHRLAAPYLARAIDLCAERGALEHVDIIGCYNRRRQRHDDTRPWSYHALAMAVDINPYDNRPRVNAPEPFSDEWRELWPDGLPAEVVTSFTDAGWRWGGWWRHFTDPMHFELLG